jgi:hypothetical protein
LGAKAEAQATSRTETAAVTIIVSVGSGLVFQRTELSLIQANMYLSTIPTTTIYLPALPPIEKCFLVTKQHRDAFIKAD